MLDDNVNDSKIIHIRRRMGMQIIALAPFSILILTIMMIFIALLGLAVTINAIRVINQDLNDNG